MEEWKNQQKSMASFCGNFIKLYGRSHYDSTAHTSEIYFGALFKYSQRHSNSFFRYALELTME